MNRRGFFKDLAIIGVAGLFLPRIEPVRWKRTRVSPVCVPNPEYFRAAYEIYIVDAPPVFDEAILAQIPEGGRVVRIGQGELGMAYPPRFTVREGRFIRVEPFILSGKHPTPNDVFDRIG